MEAINEGCKLVAQAKELLATCMKEAEPCHHIRDAAILLDRALEKLSSST
jgi:hypothetical protein